MYIRWRGVLRPAVGEMKKKSQSLRVGALLRDELSFSYVEG